MRRFHNPRYAPEFLEKRLNPSTAVPVPVAAQVYIPNTQSDANGTTDSGSADDDTSDDGSGSSASSTPTNPDPTDPGVPTTPTPTPDPAEPDNPDGSSLPGVTDPDSSSGS
jgi:hypothetical protein